MDPEGWTSNEFKIIDEDSETGSDSESDSDSDENSQATKGYSKQKFKRILSEVELLPE